MTTPYKRKLIEVALPPEDIDCEAADIVYEHSLLIVHVPPRSPGTVWEDRGVAWSNQAGKAPTAGDAGLTVRPTRRYLLRELKRDGLAVVRGDRKAAFWFPAGVGAIAHKNQNNPLTPPPKRELDR